MPLPRDPETHARLSLSEFDLAAKNIANRALAGYPAEELHVPSTEPDEQPVINDKQSVLTKALVSRADALAEKSKAKKAAEGRMYDPNKPVSEAAADQGHGPVDPKELAAHRKLRSRATPRKIKPVRGKLKLRGESEGDTEGTFQNQEVHDEQLALEGLEASIARHPASRRLE